MTIDIRPIRPSDVPHLVDMATRNPPLDVHTAYTYWVMATVGADLSCVAERAGKPLGYVTVLPGRQAGTAFLWQVCVDRSARGEGLGRRLLGNAVDRMRARDIRRFSVTIAGENGASMGLFRSVFDESLREIGVVELEHGVASEDVYGVDL